MKKLNKKSLIGAVCLMSTLALGAITVIKCKKQKTKKNRGNY